MGRQFMINPAANSQPAVAKLRALLSAERWIGFGAGGVKTVSIPRDIVVNFVRPGRDAAFDVFQVLEALLAQKFERLHRTDSALAVDVILLVRVQLGEPLCQR